MLGSWQSYIHSPRTALCARGSKSLSTVSGIITKVDAERVSRIPRHSASLHRLPCGTKSPSSARLTTKWPGGLFSSDSKT